MAWSLESFTEDKLTKAGDDVVTALLVCVGLICIIVAMRKSVPMKVAMLAYLAVP